MNLPTFALTLGCAAALTACANVETAVPTGYSGPTASIADTVQRRSNSVSNIFAVTEVDGRRIANTFMTSTDASRNKGFNLTTVAVEREVPAVLLKLKLRASPLTGAPIQQMAMQLAGTFYQAEGVVDFKPEPGRKYAVRGELKKESSVVWIEDATSGQAVTEKVSQRP